MSPRREVLNTSKTSVSQQVETVKAASAKALKQTTEFVNQMVQVSTILYLEERRRDQARLFMALANEINNQTSWLVNLVHSNNVLTIKGMAMDNPTVSMLLTRLQNQPYLNNVKLQQVIGSNVNGLPLVSFDFNAETVFPPLSVIDQGLPEVNIPDAEQVKKIITAISPDLAASLDRPELKAKVL
jgi:Tfp pilus assembly protein PilN